MSENQESKSRLIINADDFGRSRIINQAILKTITGGILRSVTVMVNMPYAQEIVELERRSRGVSIGFHLNLTTGKPILSPKQVPTIVDKTGQFVGWRTFVKRLLTGCIRGQDIEREMKAQIDRLQAMVGVISHFDSHKHIHTIPQVLKPLLRIGREYGISRIRTSRRYFVSSQGIQRLQWLMKLKHLRRIPLSIPGQIFRPIQSKLIARYGFRSPDFLLTPLPKISMKQVEETNECWCNALAYLPRGMVELNTHPGGSTHEEAIFARFKLKEFLARNHVELTNYLEI